MAQDFEKLNIQWFPGHMTKAQRMIEEDLSFLQVVGVSPEDVAAALAQKWNDFEDCLVARCAKKAGADYIVTRNVKDFERSSVKAITPQQLFDELDARGVVYREIPWME